MLVGLFRKQQMVQGLFVSRHQLGESLKKKCKYLFHIDVEKKVKKKKKNTNEIHMTETLQGIKGLNAGSEERRGDYSVN